MTIIINELGWSIKTTAEKTAQSEWSVKRGLRRGDYRAKKRGRRTIIEPQSVVEHHNSLPDAKFAPPRQKQTA